MGKGAAKFGNISGLLPARRAILKNPTTKQISKVKEANTPLPKGFKGLGYAENVAHPSGSSREPPKPKFIDVEQMIKQTVPLPKTVKTPKTPQQEMKMRQAELRRVYLAQALRGEERRLLKQEELLAMKQKLMKEKQQEKLDELAKSRSSDLTVPTLENLINQPIMRTRTPEEEEILALKRKHNTELFQFKIKQKRMADLVALYNVADEFIVSEKKLVQHIEKVFDNFNIESIRSKATSGVFNPLDKQQAEIIDAVTGTTTGRLDGQYPPTNVNQT
ncbi:HHL257Wp [Eremothecium sinecaudum]|uniref:HHL257Wp n=1 Tax=Eremothecium sinecaudum TaxID=45286 RepID=A0A109V0G2_9SACH|nr:HHL257Wp [Eremothecium sinecaudum]AMD22513.1 HHL257Wp [Eremothecium sinecaudum]